MKVDEVYGGQYLTSKDIPSSPWDTVMLKTKEQRIRGRGGDNPIRILLALKGANKALVLNKTNATRIAQLHGNDTDEWPGKAITLEVVDVEFQGEVMDGIRVKGAVPTSQPDDQIPF